MMKVYVGSILQHADMWKELRELWAPEIEITSRWIDFPNIKAGDRHATILQFQKGWIENLEDIRNSNAMICYGEPTETLRGALVEAGMALGLGKPVLCVGNNSFFGSWQYHSLCWSFSSLVGAKAKLEYWRHGEILPRVLQE